MSYYKNFGQPTNPPSFYEQGAPERERDRKRLEDWFSGQHPKRRTPYSY